MNRRRRSRSPGRVGNWPIRPILGPTDSTYFNVDTSSFDPEEPAASRRHDIKIPLKFYGIGPDSPRIFRPRNQQELNLLGYQRFLAQKIDRIKRKIYNENGPFLVNWNAFQRIKQLNNKGLWFPTRDSIINPVSQVSTWWERYGRYGPEN